MIITYPTTVQNIVAVLCETVIFKKSRIFNITEETLFWKEIYEDLLT